MDEIHFYCVICGESLCARATSAGGFCECPRCLRVVPVPGFPAGLLSPSAGCGPAFLPDILEIEIKFFCDACGNKIRADARLQGHTRDCPVCHGLTKIPAWGGTLPLGPLAAMSGGPLSHEEREFLSAPLQERREGLMAACS